MENRMKEYERVHRQISHVREIYSRIGEPLAADVIVDLYLHLGKALDAARPGVQAHDAHGPRPEKLKS